MYNFIAMYVDHATISIIGVQKQREYIIGKISVTVTD